MTGWTALIGLATAVVGLIALVIKGRSSPETLYKAACKEYDNAVKDEQRIHAQLTAEMDQKVPDRDLFQRLSGDLALAAARVRRARAERDRLRP